MKTPLAQRLARQVRVAGPLPVASFMAACLFDAEDGYYTTRMPFGREGDFITAPEISQIFGELVAIWALHLWQERSRPAPFCLAEIGPGRGTLMADMLRILAALQPAFLKAARIRMIETSPRLAAMQRERLATSGASIEWIDGVAQLPELPLILLGNELFDAVPAHQFVRTSDGWRERVVALDAAGKLCFRVGTGSIDPSLLPPGAEAQPAGTIFEVSPAREALAEAIAIHVARHGGAALMFDYGHLAPGFGDTLQAVRAHAPEDVLASPGLADLTSHVDFAALAGAAARGGAASAFLTQEEFLRYMGIFERAERLAAGRPTAAAEAIRGAVERLVAPEQMGSLFKVMAIHPPAAPPYPFDLAASDNRAEERSAIDRTT